MRSFGFTNEARPAEDRSAAGSTAKRAILENSHLELIPLKNLEEQIAHLPANSAITVTCSPVKGIPETQALSERLMEMGHRVVPHIAARLVAEPDVDVLAQWFRATGIDEFFLVGGDAEVPAGPYAEAVTFLQALLERDHGLRRIGVTAYPDGHALIPDQALSSALHAKQTVLAAAGIDGYASTQMCFDLDRITTWLAAERAAGLSLPVHIGIPGVVEKARLMKMGVRLGIGQSLRYLKKNRAAVSKMMTPGNYDPAELIDPLSLRADELGITGLHIFTFNAVEATVAWRNEHLG